MPDDPIAVTVIPDLVDLGATRPGPTIYPSAGEHAGADVPPAFLSDAPGHG